MTDEESSATSTREDLERRAWYQRRRPLDRRNASQRISAYVYGNILVLAALVPFQEDSVTAHVLIVVIGTALSTFVAHVFAEYLGAPAQESLRTFVRESAPILTSGLLPTAMLLLGLWGVIASAAAVIIAEVIIIGRIASTGMVVARLRDEKSSARVLFSGTAVAGVGLLIVLLKVILTH